MADNVMFNVSPTFNLDDFVAKLTETYQSKGFTVTPVNLNGSSMITFEKGVGGINTLLGLGVGIKANITLSNGTLNISFTEAEWTSKIIGLAVGWFLCLIPFITAIVGCINRMDLPKAIGSDARTIAAAL